MRKMKKGILCLLLAMVLVVATGCGAQDEWEAAKKAASLMENVVEDAQLREDTQKMLDAFIADDFDAAYSLVFEVASEAEFRSVYAQLQPVLAELGEYELVASNIQKNVTNGVTTVAVRYMMTAGENRLFVEVARVEGYDGLTAFYINEYVPVVTTGTLGNMQGANALQWVFLVVGMLELVFTACVFVDCCRHKMKKKWLWLLFIALGYLVFSLLVTPEQFRINFNVGALLNYTCLLRYSTGGFTARIMIPVGAIIYLFVRKTLFAKYEQLQREKALAAQPVIPEEENTPPADEHEPTPETEE